MRLHRTLAALILVAWGGSALPAQTDPTDAFVAREMKRQNIPGLSLAVLKNGRVIKSAGYGLANIKLKIPATPATVFKIASTSKQFIASAIMVLAQDGRLRIDDPMSKYLSGTPATWSGITIRHLLTHTSGLVREAPGFNASKVQSDGDVLRTAFPVPLRFVPGEKWEYSNTGYFALAEVIRVASGRPWSQYIADTIFTPAGMLATRTTPTTTTEKIVNLAQGYVDNSRLRDAPVWLALRPSGAFLSTVVDLGKWDAALYAETPLTTASRRLMWTPVKLNDGRTSPYGFGWMLAEVKGHRMVHHSGGMPGARASIARFIDAGVTIILLMNLDDVDIDAIVHGLAALHL